MRPRVNLALASLLSLASMACNPPSEEEQPCGDGQVDPPETCDDGNTNAGDGCAPTCQLAGTPTQCVTLMHGNGAPDDDVEVVLPLVGSFVAAGSLNTDGTVVAWVGRWGEQGDERWLTTITTDGADTRLRDLTTDGSTGYWAALDAAGITELAHIDETGIVLERRTLADVSLRRVRWIAGRLWAAGSSQGDLWLGALAGDTVEILLWEDHLGFDDTIGAMELHGARVLVATTLETSPSIVDGVMQPPDSEIAVIELDVNGDELTRTTVDIEGLFDTPRVRAIAGTSRGWVVAGISPTVHGTQPQVWVISSSQNSGWFTFVPVDPESASTPQSQTDVGGIVSLDDSILFAGGEYRKAETNAPYVTTGWLVEQDPKGRSVWYSHLGMPEETHYRDTAIAIDTHQRVRTVGVGWTDGVSSTLRSCLVAR